MSSSGLQPVSRGAGRRLLFYLEVRFCSGVQALGTIDWRTVPSPSAGGQDHLLEQEQGASLDQQSASKAGECSFSLKLTNFPKFMIKI